ncbi:winged helix-turn-helix transcriptional regulator [Pseudomonas sp. TH32]|uniref:winged helix-turn-helix transcriptional regulator n=1 Tax=Pseudomonas sp. TH32 TaxID=2796397 RepID=UPI001F5B3C62|nr:helix-turn-helix domain-containing protein [Pseudomonas sp. TH32]
MSSIQIEKTPCETGESEAQRCAMRVLLELITAPWTLHILLVLTADGPIRFGALRRRVEGISARVLTVRLRSLEERGLLVRRATSGKSPEVTYYPTARLHDMREFMQQMRDLSLKWQDEDLRNT